MNGVLVALAACAGKSGTAETAERSVVMAQEREGSTPICDALVYGLGRLGRLRMGV